MFSGCTLDSDLWAIYFMNSGIIRKSTTNLQFAQIPNNVLQSKELGLAEKGLLAFLLSLPDDWKIYRNYLYNALCDPPGTIDRCWKSLSEKGFIISSRKIDANGRFIGWEHVVYNQITDLKIYRDRYLPKSVITEVGESGPIQINNSIQTNINTNTQPVEFLIFEDDESNEAWKEWLQYRKEKKKSVTGRTKEMQIRLLQSLTPQERIACINQSITQGWTGLFEVKIPKKQQKNDFSGDYQAAIAKLAANSK